MGQCRTKQIMLNLVTLRWWELTESADDADWATLKVAVQKIKWEAEFGMSQANNACFEKKTTVEKDINPAPKNCFIEWLW